MSYTNVLLFHVLVGFGVVLGKIYELLGVLAEVHPSDMVNNSDKLYKAYLGELKEQVPAWINISNPVKNSHLSACIEFWY